jgi:ion channel-forming bestrophin family protein
MKREKLPMYVRRKFRFMPLLVESWPLVLIASAWSIVVVIFHEIIKFTWIAMPVLPVTLIGIAVSLYLGFKSVSAYNRWWEARTAIGTISGCSREWAMRVQSLIYKDAKTVPAEVVEALFNRHLGLVYAVAYMLRRSSRLETSKRTRIFSHRRVGHSIATISEAPQSYGRFLSPREFAAAQTIRNPVAYLLGRQGEAVRDLALSGYLDSIRQVAMMDILGKFSQAFGICERIKSTPFPRQIAHFGAMFTWIFVFLMPLAFLDVFETEAVAETTRHVLPSILTHKYMFTLVPFVALISWVFLMIEKVSDSTEDPFEGGVHDVPVSTLCRIIEIDLKQAMGAKDVPAPLEPAEDVLY